MKLLDVTIDPDVVLSGTLETKIVKARPEGMPVSVDWPEEIYTSAETPWSVSIDGTVVHISELELELIGPTLLGPIRFAVVSDTVAKIPASCASRCGAIEIAWPHRIRVDASLSARADRWRYRNLWVHAGIRQAG